MPTDVFFALIIRGSVQWLIIHHFTFVIHHSSFRIHHFSVW